MKKAAVKKANVKKAASRPRRRSPTPDQALARTHELLQAQQEQARQTPPWRLLEEQGTPHAADVEGHVSAEAAAKAQELHAGESRMRAIQGSASTHDRRNQRKRDHR